MVQIGVHEIPKSHIHKRWTRSARDVLPECLRSYQKDTLCMQSMTFRHSYLYVDAMGLVEDGNKDLGAFDIVTKSIKKAKKKLREYFAAKEKATNNGCGAGFGMQGAYYTSGSDVGAGSSSEIEGRPRNSYGAAGSSAWMSDSELLSIRAPHVNRGRGRPQETRFKGVSDYYGKRQKRTRVSSSGPKMMNSAEPSTKKRQIRCGDCQILGHNSKQCKNKTVDLNSELPEF